MKIMAYLSAMTLIMAAEGEALLPPLFQTAAEIKGMLDSPKLAQTLNSGDVIESITSTDEGFIITTNRQRVEVKVLNLPQDRPGPARFDYRFGKPEKL